LCGRFDDIMAKIIPLDEYRIRSLLRAGYNQWQKKYKEEFNLTTGLADLSPATLCQLAEPGEASTTSLCSMIIGFLGYGDSETFESLDSRLQNDILDIQMFMADQIRFEMMHRLGWLDSFSGSRYSFFKMVTAFEHVFELCRKNPPKLAKDHPRYDEYRILVDRDQQVFIRRMLPAALEMFKTLNRL